MSHSKRPGWLEAVKREYQNGEVLGVLEVIALMSAPGWLFLAIMALTGAYAEGIFAEVAGTYSVATLCLVVAAIWWNAWDGDEEDDDWKVFVVVTVTFWPLWVPLGALFLVGCVLVGAVWWLAVNFKETVLMFRQLTRGGGG